MVWSCRWLPVTSLMCHALLYACSTDTTPVLLLALVHSWKEFGKARIECLEGCRYGVFVCSNTSRLLVKTSGPWCQPTTAPMAWTSLPRRCDTTTVDLTWERDATLPEIMAVSVQPVESCKWKLTVLNETSSAGHKVKILGFMVAEENDRMRADMIFDARS